MKIKFVFVLFMAVSFSFSLYGQKIPILWEELTASDFVEAVKNNRAPDLTGEQGREILKFALAAVDSSAKGSEIYLDSYEDKPVPKKRGLLGSLFGKGN